MRSKHIQRLLRVLVMGAGAGAGAAVAFTCVLMHRMTSTQAMPLGVLVLLYGGFGAVGMLLGWLAAPKVIAGCGELMDALERQLDALSAAQLASMITGLVTGLLIAALLTQVLQFLGDSIFTVAASAALYVVLGVMGLTIGKRRAEDVADMLASRQPRRARPQADVRKKVLDATVLTDGRIGAVLKTGFVEGPLVVPDFVLEELRILADSTDEAKRIRGRRGLDMAQRLQDDPAVQLCVEDTGDLTPQEADVRLMTLVREMDATLMTGDLNLSKAARVIGMRVLNLNDLAVALRQVTAAGDVLAVRVSKEGREPGQGVGYLEDGTMLVVEGGRGCVGQTVTVTVTSVLQTSAGRMAFARLNAQEE